MNEDLSNNCLQDQENANTQTWGSNDDPMRSGILMVVVCLAAFIVVSFFGGGKGAKTETAQDTSVSASASAEAAPAAENAIEVKETGK
ncbi:MAG: hypothetical protein E7029_04200 [Planctomycetaceae bacterium]|nr:hypothetical protein [Planctomycetaceae bacterium]